MNGDTPILLNLLWLRPGEVGGSEQYVVGLLEALAASDRTLELVVRPEFTKSYADLMPYFDVQPVRTLGGRPGRVLAERALFAGAAESRVVHHLGGRVPAKAQQGTVVTIYDLQPLDFPEFFSRSKRWFLRRALPGAARASRVCVMSSFVAAGVQRSLGVPADRVRIVPPAIQAPEPRADSTGSGEESSLGYDAPYLLYPAVTWPHKRHELLVELVQHLDPELRLVFTGGPGPHHDAVMASIAASPHAERIEHLGRVSDTQLDALYRGATAVLFPSMYEGFGQPVVEAMARGCPVVAADHAALPETVGRGGMVVADDLSAWASAISSLRGPGRAEWVERGLARAADFAPAGATAAQLEVYDEVAAELG